MYRTTIPKEKLVAVAKQIDENGIKDIHYDTLKRMLGIQFLTKKDWVGLRSKAITELNHNIFPIHLQSSTYLNVVKGRGVVVLRGEEGTNYMMHQSIMKTNRKLKIERTRFMTRADNAKTVEEAEKLRAMQMWTEESTQSQAARALATRIIDEPMFRQLMQGTGR